MNSGQTHSALVQCEPFPPRLARPLAVRERWMLLLLFLVLLGLHARSVVYHGGSLRGSDGQWYYATLRSLVFDLDFDFSNELQLTPHPEQMYAKIVEKTGRYANMYPIGWTLVALGPYLLVHAVMSTLVSMGFVGPVTGYELPYQLAASLSHVSAGWGALAVMYLIARRYFNVRISSLALGFVLFGSPLLFYCYNATYMSHAAGTFLVSVFILLSIKLAEKDRASLGMWTLLGLVGALMVVTRYSNVVFSVAGLYHICRAIAAPGFRSRHPWLLGVSVLAAACAAIPVLFLQCLFWYRIFGSWITYSYGGYGFNWLHPDLMIAFSHRLGLFFYSPLTGLAIVGIVSSLIQGKQIQRLLMTCLSIGTLGLAYMNMAWFAPSFAHAFGARAYLEATPVFMLGLCALLSVRNRVMRTGTLVLSVVFTGWTILLWRLSAAGMLPPDGSATLLDILRMVVPWVSTPTRNFPG